MKILMINGSPHKMGTTALMMEKFMQGGKEAGHEINVYDAAEELSKRK